ncbi:MAG: hypothetical protein CMF41_03075 [Legionellales bacterium]|nr:hypothetical protein [Legionellales bacterium]OUX65382.1 MAG: hypothetical protein CBE41_01720 [Gammaproteobacteria bacterium TMED281]|tara:strand:- start:2724 stop:3467 length:744 start_codon:yes stop_codon:yes gene_type:complete
MDWKQKFINKLDDKVSKKISEFFVFLLKKTNISQNIMKELMSGANIQINDKGRFYTLICHDILECERHRKQNCKSCEKKAFNQYYASARFGAGSSHKSYRDDVFPQYRMGLGVLPDFQSDQVSEIFDFLIGLRLVNGKIYTWFQFEYSRGCCKLQNEKDLKNLDNTSAFQSLWNMSTIGHIKSTINYVRSKKNQGPFGESNRNDSNPISLKLNSLKDKNKNYRPIEEKDSITFRIESCNRLSVLLKF